MIQQTEEKTYGTLRIALEEGERAGRFIYLVKIWRGKQTKPYLYVSFRNLVQRADFIADEKRGDDARTAELQKRAREKCESAAKSRAEIQVGTILHYSWGYDQTNCEFFLVIERTGKASCVIQACGATPVEGSDGSMSQSLRPDPSRLFGKPMRKVIGAYGVPMDHGSARPCAADSKHYSSWYA